MDSIVLNCGKQRLTRHDDGRLTIQDCGLEPRELDAGPVLLALIDAYVMLREDHRECLRRLATAGIRA